MYFITTENVDNLLSLTATQEVSTFEVTNLQDPLGSKRWRSTNITANLPSIKGQLTSSKTINRWGLWYNNAQIGDMARLRLATTEANLTAAPVVDEVDLLAPVSSIWGAAFQSLGPNAHVDYGDVLDQFASSTFTISIRFRVDLAGIDRGLVSKRNATGAGYTFYMTAANNLEGLIDDGSTTITISASISSQLDGAWHEARMEVDRTLQVIRIYIDNTLIGTSASIAAVTGMGNAIALQAGSKGNAPTANPNFQGDLDEFRFFSRLLTTQEKSSGLIAPLDQSNLPSGLELYCPFNEGGFLTAFDKSGNNRDGTIVEQATTGFVWTKVIPQAAQDPTIDLSSWEYLHQASIVATPAAATWFQIDFNYEDHESGDNPDGFVQGGALFLDTAFTPTHGEDTNHRSMTQSRAVYNSEFPSGTIDRGNGSFKRDKRFALRSLTEDEAWGKFEPMLRERQQVKPVGVVLGNSVNKVYPMQSIYYGFLDATEVISKRNNFQVNRIMIIEP